MYFSNAETWYPRRVDPAPLRIGTVMVGHKANGFGRIGGSSGARALIHEKNGAW